MLAKLASFAGLCTWKKPFLSSLLAEAFLTSTTHCVAPEMVVVVQMRRLYESESGVLETIMQINAYQILTLQTSVSQYISNKAKSYYAKASCLMSDLVQFPISCAHI